MSRLGLTAERIGKDFGVSGSRVEQIITLKSGVLEYPWIIRAYPLSRAETQGAVHGVTRKSARLLVPRRRLYRPRRD